MQSPSLLSARAGLSQLAGKPLQSLKLEESLLDRELEILTQKRPVNIASMTGSGGRGVKSLARCSSLSGTVIPICT